MVYPPRILDVCMRPIPDHVVPRLRAVDELLPRGLRGGIMAFA